MRDPQKNKNFIVAKGPVNRRTTSAVSESGQQDAPLSPLAHMRARAANAKHRLGVPLAQRLKRVPGGAAPGHRLDTRMVVAAIAGTVSAVGVLLGMIQNMAFITGASGALLLACGGWAYVLTQRQRRSATPQAWEIERLVDGDDIARLDAAMETLAVQAGQATTDRLTRVKEVLTRCLELMAATHADGDFATEEQFFVRECVRRYVPDSIHGCLRVPPKDRASVALEGNKSAMDLLHDQLDLILSQLIAKEASLAQLTGERLLQQQRFLAAKASAP